MALYPKNLFDNKWYVIKHTSGEARALFGDPKDLPKGKRLEVNFKLGEKETVEFKVKNAAPKNPKRNFVKESGGSARLMHRGNPYSPLWPSREGLVMGFINRRSKKHPKNEQQLFLMWVERTWPLIDPFEPFTLMIYFFNTNDCFSGSDGPIDGSSNGAGQESGGGVGNGPNKA